MRWSLILPAFITVQTALSFVCVALPVSLSSDGLERRARVKASSKTYRENSKVHDYSYTFDSNTGSVSKQKLEEKDRKAHGELALKIPHTDADHVFEIQMFNNHLLKHKLEFKNLPSELQKKATDIINGPKNMAPIPASINRGKGQSVKKALEGGSVKPKKDRDEYMKLSYGTARKTAKSLDRAFKEHGYKFKKHETFHRGLHKTFVNAKLLAPGQPSPPPSRPSSPEPGLANSKKRKAEPPAGTRKRPRVTTTATKKAENAPNGGSTKAGPRRSSRIQTVKAGTPQRASPPTKPARKSSPTKKILPTRKSSPIRKTSPARKLSPPLSTKISSPIKKLSPTRKPSPPPPTKKSSRLSPKKTGKK